MNILKKISLITAMSVMLSLSGCKETIKNHYGNGLKSYSGVSDSMNIIYQAETPVEGIDNIGAMTCDDSFVYVIGNNYANIDGYNLDIFDCKTNNLEPLKTNIEYTNISNGIISENYIYLLYTDKEYKMQFAVTDSSGSCLNQIELVDNELIQCITSSGNHVYIFCNTKSNDGSCNFYMKVFDNNLNFEKSVDMNQLLQLEEDEGVFYALCDKDGNFYIQTLCAKESETEAHNIKITKMSPDLEKIYTIDNFSGMHGYGPVLSKVNDNKIFVYSFDSNNKMMYENIYSGSDGILISMIEKEETPDDIFCGVSEYNIGYQKGSVLYGCNTSEETESILYDFKDAEIDISHRILFSSDSKILISSQKYNSPQINLNIYDKSAQFIEQVTIPLPDSFDFDNISQICVHENKLFFICKTNSTENENNCPVLWLCTYDLSVKKAQWIDSDKIKKQIFDISSIQTDGENIIFLAEYLNKNNENIHQELIYTDPENLQNITKTENLSDDEVWNSMLRSENGDIFLYSSSSEAMIKNISNNKLYKSFENKPIDNVDVCISDGLSFSGYNLSNCCVKSKSLNLNINSCMPIGDNNIICLATDVITMEHKLIIIKNINDSQSKKIKVCCPDGLNFEVRNAAYNYNKLHDDYYIDLISFENQEQFKYALLDDDGCDIIISNPMSYLENYARKSTFCNLSTFIDNDDSIHADEFIAGGINSKEAVYCVYPEFSLSTFVGNKAFVSEKQLCGISELSVFADENKDKCLFDFSDKNLFARQLLEYNIHELIDYEKINCNFNNEIFDTIINLADDYVSANNSNKTDALINYKVISNIKDLGNINNSFNIAGIPDKSDSSAVIVPQYSFSVCEKSQNKDIAWDFIKTFFSDEYQQHVSSLPVKGSAYSENVKSEEDKKLMDKMFKLVDDSILVSPIDPAVSSIIDGQLSLYFDGNISTDELKTNLQSKVSLYLQENS